MWTRKIHVTRCNMVEQILFKRKVDKAAAEPGAMEKKINTMRKQKRKLRKLRMPKRKQWMNIWALTL